MISHRHHVRLWMPTASRDVRSQGQSGKHLLGLSFSDFDPFRTSPYVASPIPNHVPRPHSTGSVVLGLSLTTGQSAEHG
jgi:hypothetical protein